MDGVITKNFKLSVWATIFGCAILFWNHAQGFPESLAHLGAYQNQTLIAPAIICVLTLLLWFAFYRDEEGHLAAFMVGFFLLVPVVGSSVSEAVNGAYYSNMEQLFLLYTGGSHVAYGLLKWQVVLEALGRDAR